MQMSDLPLLSAKCEEFVRAGQELLGEIEKYTNTGIETVPEHVISVVQAATDGIVETLTT